MASRGNIAVNTTSPKDSSSNASDGAGSGKGGQCLCSPTTHQGSFRCKFHRSTSSSWKMKRSKSMPADNSSVTSFSPKSVEST
ncbi:hypothetical protein HRI_004413300 [Hibiscus trionum]|uniref:Serine-rich protein n=1 Tax=Hibiscus trionum TaxID=183268 RepID=A0A9W7J3U9_HIBTR|nr:hypothetical protein HRI_004413300 [Hibiscus trionum]